MLAYTRGCYFENLASTHSKKEDPLSDEGIKLYRSAIEQFTTALHLKPKYLDALHHRGYCYWRVGENDHALTDLSEAVALSPKDKRLWKTRAWVNRELGNYDGCISDYTMVLQLDPKEPTALAARGAAEQELGQTKTAFADLDAAVKMDPQNAWLYTERATSYRRQHDLRAMYADFEKAVSLTPHDADLYQKRAYSEFVVGDYNAAESDFSAVREIGGPNYRAAGYCSILGALSCLFENRKEDANEWLEKAIISLNLPVATTDGAQDAQPADKWPGPIVQFLHGDISADRLLIASGGGQDKSTEAHCYIALKQLVDKDPKKAEVHFRWVKDHGNKNFIEYDIAVDRLEHLRNP